MRSLWRMPQSAAAAWWLSTALGPHASTAAIQRPCLREQAMPDRVDAAVDRAQQATLQPIVDCSAAEAKL